MRGRVAALDTLRDGRRAAALMADGQLHDLLIDPPAAWGPAQPGAIFLARMGRPMKGMGGAMVDLGGGQSGFLREAKGLSPGAALVVQVATVAEPGKAPPVSPRPLFKSRHAIAAPGAPGINVSRRIRDDDLRARVEKAGAAAMAGAPADMGLILRSAAAHADPAEVEADAREMRALAERAIAADGAPALLVAAADAHLAAWRDWSDPDPDQVDDAPGAFDRHGVWEAIAAARQPEVALGQGRMTVEPTRALVAVDVDTGGDTSLAAGLKANVAAFRALPRALAVRGLGGQVVVDVAPFPKKERSQLEQVMKGALRGDPGEMQVAGWTPLGHLELRRKRDRHALRDLIRDVLPDL